MKKLLYLLILPITLFLVSCGGGGSDDLQPVTQSLEETLVGNKWCLSNSDNDGFLLKAGGGFFTTKKCTPHDWEGSWIIENNLIKYSVTNNSVQTTTLWGEVTEFSSTEIKILISNDQTTTLERVYSLTPEDIYGCNDVNNPNYNPLANCIDEIYCVGDRTYIPDDNFEQALIYLGYDTVLDDSVLTSNIDVVSQIELNGRYISDLTGIEAFISLTHLHLENNQITSVDLSSNTALNYLIYAEDQTTSLDLSSNTALGLLYCVGTKITSLNLSSNTELHILILGNNQLTSLDLRNGNNSNLSDISTVNNPNLNCINVDNFQYSYNNWFNIDPQHYFSENCP